MKKSLLLTLALLGSGLAPAATAATRYIRVTGADQLQDGRQYTMGTIRPSYVAVPAAAGDCWPRFLKLNESNQAVLEVHHDVTTFGPEFIWTFTADASRDCGIAHNDKSTFYTLKNGDRYVRFWNSEASLATVAESEIQDHNYGEFIPVKSPTDMGFVFKVHYYCAPPNQSAIYRTFGADNSGSFVQLSANNTTNTNTISLENTGWTAAWQLYWVVDEAQYDVETVARALWNEKVQNFTIEDAKQNVRMEYTAEEIATHLSFPENISWSYETLDQQIEDAWNACVPRTSLVRVTCDDMLVEGMKYVFYCVGEHELFPQAYCLNTSNNLAAGKLPETGDITPYIWTFHAPGDATPSTYVHDGYTPGKIFAMSNSGRYARFGNTATTTSYSHSNDFELPHSSIHTVKGEAGSYYTLCTDRASASGNFAKTRGVSIATNGTVGIEVCVFSMSATNYIDQCNFTNNNGTYSTVHCFDLVIHSWYLDEVAPLLWAAKRAAVNSGDFSDEVKSQILAATTTVPEADWAFETLQSDIDNRFNQAVSEVLAANLTTMANEMVDSHFAELKAWSEHCSDDEITAAVNALIERVKGEINLSPDREWTTDEILEHVNNKYTELGVMTLDDEFTAILAGKTLNIVRANTTGANTCLQLASAKNKLVETNAAYTTFDFEKVEGETALRIREVCTGLYLGAASIYNNVAIPLTADVNAAGLWRVQPVNAAESEELLIHPDGITNRYLYCDAATNNGALVMSTQNSPESHWTLKSASKLDAFNTALGAVAADNAAKVTEYATYGTVAFLTADAINGASEVYSNPFTAADELTPAAYASRVDEYNSEVNELWSQSVINGKEMLLNVSRSAVANQFLEVNAAGSITTTTGDLHAKNVWKFIHESNDLFRVYNVESGKYIYNNNGTPALTDNLETAGLFRFAKPNSGIANIEKAIFLEDNSRRDIANKYLHLGESGLIYWSSGAACSFLTSFTDEDVAAAAKLPCGFNIPDVSEYKTTVDEGYAIGGYDAELKAEVVAALAAITAYIDENVGEVELTALLNHRDEMYTEATEIVTAFENSKSKPQSGMYITLTSSPENTVQGATLFDNGNERNNNTTVSASGNFLRLSATEEHPITDFNKIWLYKDGKMYNYGTGHHLEGKNIQNNEKCHLSISTAATESEEAAASGATEISFVNAYNEKNEFQMIHSGARAVHIADGPVANTCTSSTTVTDLKHNWHIDLVTELPVAVYSDGFGSFASQVAFCTPTTGDYTFYRAEKESNGFIIFKEVEGGTKLAAGNVVIVEGAEGTAHVTALYGADAADAVEAPTHEWLTSTYAAVTHTNPEGKLTFAKSGAATASQVSLLAATKSVTLAPVTDTKPVNALTLTVPSNSPYISNGNFAVPLGESMNTTGIVGIELHQTNGDVKVYDLQGRRLAAPVHGVNIINGRKVLVK